MIVSGETLHDLCDVLQSISGERGDIYLCPTLVDEGDAAMHAGEDVSENGVAVNDSGGAAAVAVA